MNRTAVAIGCLLLIGGVAGLLSPHEWTYTTGSRLSASQGPWVIDKTGTRILAIAAAGLGLASLYIGTKK